MTTDKRNGFTLIELSIVLVIIGLIVGGILVGQDMIRQATVRAQISQLQKYNTAVNTFVTKYGDLPGDMPPGPAASFGFYAGVDCDGINVRNGNGMIGEAGNGEEYVVWLDLSMAGLIDHSFTLAPWTAAGQVPCNGGYLPVAANQKYPDAKLTGNSVMVNPDGAANWSFIVSSSFAGNLQPPYFAITVADAFAIDTKIDDGKPTTGNVRAQEYQMSVTYQAGTISYSGVWNAYDAYYSAATDSGTTALGTPACWNSTTMAYATTYQGGTSQACWLSVKLQ